MGRERNGGESGGRPVDARVARRRQDPIGRRLRKIYTDVVEESVPDEFMAILEEAQARQGDPSTPEWRCRSEGSRAGRTPNTAGTVTLRMADSSRDISKSTSKPDQRAAQPRVRRRRPRASARRQPASRARTSRTNSSRRSPTSGRSRAAFATTRPRPTILPRRRLPRHGRPATRSSRAPASRRGPS
jgi:hypothetical protein